MSFNLKGDPDPESCAEPTTKRVSKFGKCSSLSSVRTASEGYLEEQTLCRKINLAQKETFIQMITEDNLNMKEVTPSLPRLPGESPSATAPPKKFTPVFGTSSKNG